MVSCSEDSNLVLFDATSGTVLQSLDMGASLALSLTWYVPGRACEFRFIHAHAGLHACAQARTQAGTVREGPRTEQGLHDRGPDEVSMLVATGGKRVKVTCVCKLRQDAAYTPGPLQNFSHTPSRWYQQPNMTNLPLSRSFICLSLRLWAPSSCH